MPNNNLLKKSRLERPLNIVFARFKNEFTQNHFRNSSSSGSDQNVQTLKLAARRDRDIEVSMGVGAIYISI